MYSVPHWQRWQIANALFLGARLGPTRMRQCTMQAKPVGSMILRWWQALVAWTSRRARNLHTLWSHLLPPTTFFFGRLGRGSREGLTSGFVVGSVANRVNRMWRECLCER